MGPRDVVARRPILPLDHVHIVMYDAKNDRDNNAIFGRVGNSMTCFTLSGHNVKPPDAIFTSAKTNDAVYRGVSPKKTAHYSPLSVLPSDQTGLSLNKGKPKKITADLIEILPVVNVPDGAVLRLINHARDHAKLLHYIN